MILSRRQKVFVALSGGVDSSVAAALLKKRGFDVTGIHIKMWSDPDIPCTLKEDRLDAMRAAAHLKIPCETWDFTDAYRREVVDYMIREYAAGRTPNPDIMCNRHIKFGIFLKRAREAGADCIATGHYVRLEPEFPISNYQFLKSSRAIENLRIENPLKIENCKLKIAKDSNKDQSYFLWTLTQNQLKHCLFPVGEYTKPEVRDMARKLGLPTAEKPDSQGICFIGEIDLRRFLQKYIPKKSGVIETASGRGIGAHEGLAFYTIGQRQGLAIGGGIPYYVAEKDFSRNALIVAEGPYDQKLFKKEACVGEMNWIGGSPPKMPFSCEARIRYRQPLQRCIVETETGNGKSETGNSKLETASLKVVFSDAQRAVTPGQSIVFYKNHEMLGGACIF